MNKPNKNTYKLQIASNGTKLKFMQVPIYRMREQNGYLLYRREQTKFNNTAPMRKYFIKKDDGKTYYKEFRSLPSANKAWKELTEMQPTPVPTTGGELPEQLEVSIGYNHKGNEVYDLQGSYPEGDRHIAEAGGKEQWQKETLHELVRRYNAFPNFLLQEQGKDNLIATQHKAVTQLQEQNKVLLEALERWIEYFNSDSDLPNALQELFQDTKAAIQSAS